MFTKANDGRTLWAIWITVIACVMVSDVIHAQEPQRSDNGRCEMRLLDAPKPVYPAKPLRGNEVLKSPVVVDLVINDDGTVKTVRLTRSSGIRTYDKAVLQAVKKWRYNKSVGCRQRKSTVTVAINPTGNVKGTNSPTF
jgi:TonB family protein